MSNCELCLEDNEPSFHKCIVCNKKVHVLKECSVPTNEDQDERMCIPCQNGTFTIIISKIVCIIILFNISLDACQIDFDASDYSSFKKTDENTKSLTNAEENTYEKDDQNTKKPTLKTFFDYKFIDNMKYGKCKLCVKDMIKMKNSNTTGLKMHLFRNHKKEHDIIYGKQMDSKSQNKLDLMVKVRNIFI